MIKALRQTFAVHVTSGPGNQNLAHCWIHYWVYGPVHSPESRFCTVPHWTSCRHSTFSIISPVQYLPYRCYSKFYCHCDIPVSVTYVNAPTIKEASALSQAHASGNQTLSFVGGIRWWNCPLWVVPGHKTVLPCSHPLMITTFSTFSKFLQDFEQQQYDERTKIKWYVKK